jgi:hypothetical protein
MKKFFLSACVFFLSAMITVAFADTPAKLLSVNITDIQVTGEPQVGNVITIKVYYTANIAGTVRLTISQPHSMNLIDGSLERTIYMNTGQIGCESFRFYIQNAKGSLINVIARHQDATDKQYITGCAEYLLIEQDAPYQVGDTLRFVNENNDTLAFGVSEAWYVKPKTTKDEGGLLTDCDCAMCDNPESHFGSFHNDYGQIGGSIYFVGGGLVCIYVIFDGNKSSDDDVFAKDAQSGAFGDTIVWDKTDARRVNHVVVVKGLGITEFYDVATNDLWKSIVK